MDASIIQQLLDAIQGRNWIVAIGLGLSLLVAAARWFLGGYVPWFKTDRGGAALILAAGLLGAVGVTLASGTVTPQTLLDGLWLAFTAAGGYVTFKKIFFPSDQPPQPTPNP